MLGVVTDSPSVMVSFRTLMETKNPWIKKMRCILHDLNTITKWILKTDNIFIKKVIKDDKKLVNYFNESAYYKELLEDWRKENEVTTHG